MGIRPTEFIQSFFKYLKKSEMEPAPLGQVLVFYGFELWAIGLF